MKKARERWRQFINDKINLADNGVTIPLQDVDAMFDLGCVCERIGLCVSECMCLCVCVCLYVGSNNLVRAHLQCVLAKGACLIYVS